MIPEDSFFFHSHIFMNFVLEILSEAKAMCKWELSL